jgi:hypothetical protein
MRLFDVVYDVELIDYCEASAFQFFSIGKGAKISTTQRLPDLGWRWRANAAPPELLTTI